jgi:hypothetical protein
MTSLCELFSDAKRWTKGSGARDDEGNPTYSGSPKATCFCLYGGVNYLGSNNIEFSRYSTVVKLSTAIQTLYPKRACRDALHDPYAIVINFNDDERTTFEDIRKVEEHARV